MTANTTFPNSANDVPTYNHALQRLKQLQTDLVATARMWAIDEVGAAVAHQLNEPLTALLIYLREIQRAHEEAGGTSTAARMETEVIANAVREAERACNILGRIRHDIENAMDAQAAIAQGRNVIDACSRRIEPAEQDSAAAPLLPYPLTPREQEVLRQITGGASNKEGSYRLGMSTRTFEAHRAHIMRKFGARNTADLVRRVMNEAKQ